MILTPESRWTVEELPSRPAAVPTPTPETPWGNRFPGSARLRRDTLTRWLEDTFGHTRVPAPPALPALPVDPLTVPPDVPEDQPLIQELALLRVRLGEHQDCVPSQWKRDCVAAWERIDLLEDCLRGLLAPLTGHLDYATHTVRSVYPASQVQAAWTLLTEPGRQALAAARAQQQAVAVPETAADATSAWVFGVPDGDGWRPGETEARR